MYDKMDEKALGLLGMGQLPWRYEFLHENLTHFVYLGIDE